MIKLVFAGDLITGFGRAQVVRQLAVLLQRDEAHIIEALFNGTPVIVKKVSSTEEAYQWRKDFAAAGAVLMIANTAKNSTDAPQQHTPEATLTLDEQLEENVYEASDSGVTGALTEEPTLASEASRVPGVRRRNQAYILMGVLVLGAIVVIVSVLWLSRPLWQS